MLLAHIWIVVEYLSVHLYSKTLAGQYAALGQKAQKKALGQLMLSLKLNSKLGSFLGIISCFLHLSWSCNSNNLALSIYLLVVTACITSAFIWSMCSPFYTWSMRGMHFIWSMWWLHFIWSVRWLHFTWSVQQLHFTWIILKKYFLVSPSKSFIHFSVTFQLSGGNTSLGRDTNNATLARIVRTSSKIPQVDGPIPDPYEDVLSTPNVSVLMQLLHVNDMSYFYFIKLSLEYTYASQHAIFLRALLYLSYHVGFWSKLLWLVANKFILWSDHPSYVS